MGDSRRQTIRNSLKKQDTQTNALDDEAILDKQPARKLNNRRENF